MKLLKKRFIASIGTGLLLGLMFIFLNCQTFGAGGPVNTYGQLKVVGSQLCDRTGKPVALRGVSLFWSNWDSGFYNSDVVQWLRDDWKCSVIRAAMGIEPPLAYLSNPEAQKEKIIKVVEAAINQGIYVIIDWHDHNAQKHTEQAKEFFAGMARKYGGYPNVIYELYNEPENAGWSTVKSYAEEVIAAIRKYDKDNIIIVGTPSWCQDVDWAAEDPIRKANIVYALHFYAGSHKKWLRDKATSAMKRGIALFISEWGTCSADGSGAVDSNESDVWLDFMKKNNLSWCNWAISNKDETTSALSVSASRKGNWSPADLTASGRYVREKLLSLSNDAPSANSTVMPSPVR